MLANYCFKYNLKKKVTIKVFSCLIVLLLISTLTGCNSLEDAAEKAKLNIPEGYALVHIEQVSEDSGVIFYTYEHDLSVGIFTKNSFGWDWVGSGSGKLVTYPEGLHWRYTNLVAKDKKNLSLYYGKVINEDIQTITVTTTQGETVEGKIVDTDQLRLWYAFVSEPQVPCVNADIVGYSKDNKVVYLFSQPKE
ncbi:MAG: hypothetical protein GX248_06890 [Peptococcaceae bacterium]|jgi:(2Fe-2S) ferredoxin|nr:hypothetical protein [Peptococcaceae bacterium]